MTTISTSFSFKLTGVTGTPINFTTRQNVTKRIAKIVYLAAPPTDAAKLAYVGSEEIVPAVNLFIGDRSDSLHGNSQTNTASEFITDGNVKNISVVNSSFLVTQIFIEAESGFLPLYYKHNLPSTIIPESVEVFDINYNKVGFDKWKLIAEYIYDDTTGISTGVIDQYNLFNSLVNSHDTVTDTSEVYFVQYTDSVSSVETTYTKILDNEKAFLPATVDDFWPITPGDLKPWCYAYYYENYNVQLPNVGTSAINYLESQRISVQLPNDYTDTQPWFPRIANGEFQNIYGGYNNSYAVPEFINQAFNPITPYKLAAAKQCEKIDTRLLKLPNEEIQVGTIFNKISITFEKDDVVEYAITTDSTLDGVAYRDFDGTTVTDSNGDQVNWSVSNLLGFDRISGIVNVGFDILNSYKIFATFPYRENHYLLTGLTMNPIFNADIHTQTTVVYVVPENEKNDNTNAQTVSVMWLKVARSGKIVSTTQDSTGGNPDISQTITRGDTGSYYPSGVVDMHYSWEASTLVQAQAPASSVDIVSGGTFTVDTTVGFPRSGWLRVKDDIDEYRYFKYTDITNFSFQISTIATDIPNGTVHVPDGNTVELVNFINEHSTGSDRDADAEVAAFGGAGTILPNVFSRYFILAAISVNPTHNKEALSIIDVRENGGGIDPDTYEEAKVKNPEVQWLSGEGSFNGQVYPSNAVVVVKLPHTVLDDFTLDNVRKIVSENVAYGVYPLIRFYGYEPRVISMLPGSVPGSTVVTWQKDGPEFTYTIWTAPDPKGPWTPAHTYLITDGSGTYNTFTVTGLSELAVSYIKVTMEDRYYAWWYSCNGYNSIGGGLGLDEDTPVAPFGNVANFVFEIESPLLV